MEGEKQGQKILMVPWLAHSHATPFFELAKKLISKSNNSFHIYLCSTSVVLNFLKQNQEKYLSENALNVELIELNLPSSVELPSYHFTTKGLPKHLGPALFKAFQMDGRESFSNIVNNIKPDLIIDDLFQTWAPEIGLSRNIPVVQLFVSSAAYHSFMYHLYLHDGTTDDYPFPEICLPDYVIEVRYPRINASRTKRIEEFLGFGARKMSSDIILINNWKETEAKYMQYLSFITNKKILGVGPLLAQIDQNTTNTTTTTTEDDMIIDQWLDKRDRFSTVYVMFGSEIIWSKENIQEIAHGLEVSNVNFLWVLRYPGYNVEEILPQGFAERVEERGLVMSKWVPHAKIMSHPSLGGFFTHCGWNSTLECIHFGVPIIAMPNNTDQFITAKYVANVLGNGLEVERDETLTMKREDIAKAIREVIVEKKGEQMRERSRELSDKIRKEQAKDIEQEVVEELICLMKKKEINND